MTEKPKPTSRSTILPKVGAVALPMWLLVLTVVLGWRGCVYVDSEAGGLAFKPTIYGPYHSESELENLRPKSGSEEKYIKGKAAYNLYCSVCHQPTGMGTPGVFPPLAQSDWVLAEGPNRLIRIVLKGVQGPITVNGTGYNNVMPPFGDVMTDEQIAQVLTYVRMSRDWGNEAGEVNPEQVAPIRSEVEGRATSWSAQELLEIPVN